jgi:hypothetical protein
MRTLVPVVSLVLVFSAPAAAQVVLDQWGTYATTVYADCADFCDPDTDFSLLLSLTFGSTNSGAELDIVDSTISNSRGDAFAEASVQAPLSPQVRVNAESLAGGWVDGTATAVQGFTYLGLVADTIDVNVQLTGTIGNPDADPGTGLAAQVSYIGNANVASVVFENALLGLVAPDGAVQFETNTDGAVNMADVLSIPVLPGDQFYLIASSGATAGGANAFAESLGTLSVSFGPSDAANLEAANGAVAVPALNAVWLTLLGIALGSVGILARERPQLPSR